MPILKQVLYSSNLYAENCHEELLDDYNSILENVSLHHEEFRSRDREVPQHISEPNDPLSIAQSNLRSARAFSSILGALHQLSYITVTANDIFKNLTLISSDAQERIRRLSSRTADLLSSSPKVGSRMKFSNKTEKRPDAVVPSLFMKNTNCAGLLHLFRMCRPVPQLWRIEVFLPSGADSCYKSYSYPGYFFERWVQEELQRQKAQREQRKADKKAIRLEKRKIRDLETMNRLDGNEPQAQQQPSTVAYDDDEAMGGEDPAPQRNQRHIGGDDEDDQDRLSNAKQSSKQGGSSNLPFGSENSPVLQLPLPAAHVAADKHRSVLSKVFRFKNSDKSTAGATTTGDNADVTAPPEKVEKKSAVLMDIVRQTTIDKLAARRHEETQASISDSAAGARGRDKERDRHKEKDKRNLASSTGRSRLRVTMAEGENQSQAIPSVAFAERDDANSRGKSRGSVVERKVIPKRASKTRKYNAERFMQSALVDYATEGRLTPMGEAAPGIASASSSSAVDGGDTLGSLRQPSLLRDSAVSDVQNRRQQVMSMKLGSKIVVSSTGNFTSKNKGRQASLIVRSALPTTATLSEPEATINTPTGRRLNKLPEESEGGSSRNGSIGSRSNSILNYDKDSNLLRSRPLLPRYDKEEHSEEEGLRRQNFEAAASEAQASESEGEGEGEGDKRSSMGLSRPQPPPPPPPASAATESLSSAPRPPPPPPPVLRPALPADILGGIRSRKGDGEGENGLRKVPEPQARPLDPMAGLLLSIKSGSKNLKSVPAEALAAKASKPVEQNKAIAAILANRSKIAGSDSDSDDSDSDFTDDMY